MSEQSSRYNFLEKTSPKHFGTKVLVIASANAVLNRLNQSESSDLERTERSQISSSSIASCEMFWNKLEITIKRCYNNSTVTSLMDTLCYACFCTFNNLYCFTMQERYWKDEILFMPQNRQLFLYIFVGIKIFDSASEIKRFEKQLFTCKNLRLL